MAIEGRVIKGVGGKYTVAAGGEKLVCAVRGRIKLEDRICVGDLVRVSVGKGGGVIEEILPRRNLLIRPYISNVDQMCVFVAGAPKADFLLVDKLLAELYRQNIDSVIAVNKADVNPEGFADEVRAEYEDAADAVIEFSARSEAGLAELRELLKGKFTCFAGQSAVGKTTVLNVLSGMDLPTGELSEKIERGRHTTRHSEIYDIGGAYLADTPGFSGFEPDVRAEDLHELYPDFIAVGTCRFTGCTHMSEPDCEVKAAVEDGRLAAGRYERYKEFFSELKGTKIIYSKGRKDNA